MAMLNSLSRSSHAQIRTLSNPNSLFSKRQTCSIGPRCREARRDLPGVLFAADCLGGEQIPGISVAAHHDQEQRMSGMAGMPDGCPRHAQAHQLVGARIPEHALLLPLSLADHRFPGRPTVAFG